MSQQHVRLILSLTHTPMVYKRNYLQRGDRFNLENEAIGFAQRLASRPAGTASEICIQISDKHAFVLDVRSQGDDGIDARGAARWKIRRQQRYCRQGP